MRCCIDATSIRPDRLTGIERYTQHVATDLPGTRPDWDWVIIARDDVDDAGLACAADMIVVQSRSRLRREAIDLSGALRAARADLIHFPGFPPPVHFAGGTAKVVLTVHDANYWLYRDTLSLGTRLYYKPALTRQLRRRQTRLVLTHSLAAASDVRPFVPSRIPVCGVPLGVDVRVAGARQEGDARPDRADPQDFLLAVGTIEPRKNYGTLLAALARLVAEGIDVPRLKIAGRVGWGPEIDVPPAIRGRVELCGSISERELTDMYRGARLFVMPSRYEGFGLPLLEAMMAGCNCIAADIPALRELGGETVAYADPSSPEAWAEQIKGALAAGRPNHAPCGAAARRARGFSWEKWAQGTAAAIATACPGI